MQVKAISACPDTDSTTVGGDPAEVFSRLYAENFGRVRGWLYRRVGNWDLAEDLAQETFAKVWADVAAGTVDPGEVYAFGWLVNRASWTVSRHYGRARVRRETAVEDQTLGRLAADATDHPMDLVAARIGLGQIIMHLPFVSRRVLALHFLEGLRVSAVAAVTGQGVPVVVDQLAEALAELRVLLGVSAAEVAARLKAEAEARAVAAQERAQRRALAPAPVAAQIRDQLRAAIRSGRFGAGSVLPSCRALTAEFMPGCSQATADSDRLRVSRALRQLAREGLLTRTPAGYVVPARKLTQAAPPRIPAPRRSPESLTGVPVRA